MTRDMARARLLLFADAALARTFLVTGDSRKMVEAVRQVASQSGAGDAFCDALAPVLDAIGFRSTEVAIPQQWVAREGSTDDLYLLGTGTGDVDEAFRLFGERVYGMTGRIDTGNVDIDVYRADPLLAGEVKKLELK